MTLLCCLFFVLAFALPTSESLSPSVSARRSFLAGAAAALVISPSRADSFDNRISKAYDDRPKQRGSMPPDLGVSKRKDLAGEEYLGLKPCGAAPNCFCSTDHDDEEHSIPAWKWPSSLTQEEAFIKLMNIVQEYQPGQGNVDGGGFKLVTSKPNYLYVQFESLKNGFIDDVEFAILDNAVHVRSSSRLGYLDYGVNAKRLNYIASALRNQGWEAEGVDFTTHQGYVLENRLQ